MEPPNVASIQEGFQEVFLLSWPLSASQEDAHVSLCMVVMKREGGILLGLPAGFLPPEDLQLASSLDGDTLLGPHTVLSVPGVILDAEAAHATGLDLDVQVVDVTLDVLSGLAPFPEDGLEEDSPVIAFAPDIHVVPDPATLLRFVREWLRMAGVGRSVFYSAVEEAEVEGPASPKAKEGKARAAKPKAVEKAKRASAQQVAEQIQQLSKMMPIITSTLGAIQEEQRRLQTVVEGAAMSPPPRPTQVPVSMSLQQFSKMIGPPPKVKSAGVVPPPPKKASMQPVEPSMGFLETEEMPVEEDGAALQADSLALAVLEQSRALTSLVTHIQSGGDPLLDHHLSSMTASTKGAQGRERLQQELASRTGGFCLAVAQNAYKRLRPASKLPQSLDEIAATDFSMLTYLERFGGYGNSKDLGLMQYALSSVLDCAIRGDLEGVREHAALMTVGLEQAAQDQGRWDLGFQLMLLEDPPTQMWSYRAAGASQLGRVRAFAPLCPQKWATIALAYAKEIDFIQNRRLDLGKKSGAPPPAAVPPAPKKKWGGGKSKAKGSGGGSMQPSEEMEQS